MKLSHIGAAGWIGRGSSISVHINVVYMILVISVLQISYATRLAVMVFFFLLVFIKVCWLYRLTAGKENCECQQRISTALECCHLLHFGFVRCVLLQLASLPCECCYCSVDVPMSNLCSSNLILTSGQINFWEWYGNTIIVFTECEWRNCF